MRSTGLLFAGLLLFATSAAAQSVGTMSELMTELFIRRPIGVLYHHPNADHPAQWNELQGQTLMLAESANLLMMPGHARDQDQWMADAKLMRDAGAAAFKAAKNKDLTALDALNDQLYQSCTTCHMHYRPQLRPGATPCVDLIFWSPADSNPPKTARSPAVGRLSQQESRVDRARGSIFRRAHASLRLRAWLLLVSFRV